MKCLLNVYKKCFVIKGNDFKNKRSINNSAELHLVLPDISYII